MPSGKVLLTGAPLASAPAWLMPKPGPHAHLREPNPQRRVVYIERASSQTLGNPTTPGPLCGSQLAGYCSLRHPWIQEDPTGNLQKTAAGIWSFLAKTRTMTPASSAWESSRTGKSRRVGADWDRRLCQAPLETYVPWARGAVWTPHRCCPLPPPSHSPGSHALIFLSGFPPLQKPSLW